MFIITLTWRLSQMTTDLSFIRQIQYDLGMRFFSPTVFEAYLSENNLPNNLIPDRIELGKLCISALEDKRHAELMAKREKDVILQHLTACYLSKGTVSEEAFTSWRLHQPNPKLIHTSRKVLIELKIVDWSESLPFINSDSIDIQQELYKKKLLKDSLVACQSYFGFKDITSKEYAEWREKISKNASPLSSFYEYDFSFKTILHEVNLETKIPDRTDALTRPYIAELFQELQEEFNVPISEDFYTEWKSNQPIPSMYPDFSVIKRRFHPLAQLMKEYDILYVKKSPITFKDVYKALEQMVSEIGWKDYRRATYANWRRDFHRDNKELPTEYEIITLFGGWRNMISAYKEEKEQYRKNLFL